MDPRRLAVVPLMLAIAACSTPGGSPAPPQTAPPPPPTTSVAPNPNAVAQDGRPFEVNEVATFDRPWAMAFLPDGRALLTEKGGTLRVVDPQTGRSTKVTGTPEVVDEGQGGLADVALGPTYDEDGTIYLSWVEKTDEPGETRGVVGKARLVLDGPPALKKLTTIWRQDPQSGSGHYSLRLAISPDGDNLFVTSGERQKFTPAQDVRTDLGKILRLTLDGEHVDDNPFADQHEKAATVWSYGHRNVLGIAFDAAGNLWASEMGPKGGDELNLIEPGADYGWPDYSEGAHYDGRAIPPHSQGASKDIVAPVVSWVPSISPANLMIYSGTAFPAWKGDALIGGLSGQCLVRVHLDGTTATKADQWDMGARIRDVVQGPDGAIWLLTDGPDGKLLRLTPPR